MKFNLNGTGDFIISDNGTEKFEFNDGGTATLVVIMRMLVFQA